MKKMMLFAIGAGALALTGCQKEEGVMLQPHDSNKTMGIMHAMMARMDSLPKTSDPEIDFARMMVIHHQGAIDMSNLELKEGKNDIMRQMAEKIISAQKEEIQQFNAILARIKVDDNDPSFTMEQKANMMKGAKMADVQLITGDIDNDFATLMNVHHQGAIDNSGAYLHHGNNTELKAMANKIIESQVKEIMDFSDWLKSNKR